MTETSGTVGYGQQYPRHSDDEVNSIDFAVRQLMAQMSTTKLVQVVAVHGGDGAIIAAGTVDVLPLVNQIDGAGNSTANDTVYGIPWFRLQGGNSAIIVDPVAGDVGYVTCCDRDISNVKASLAQSNPGSFRKFDISDGVYIGGCLCVAPGQYLVFTLTGCRLVDINGNSITMSSTGINLTDCNSNQIQMKAGAVNIVTPVLQVNGVPVTVP